MTRAAPQNAPVEAQATLPWGLTPPPVSARPAGPFAPAGWRWAAHRPADRGWGVAVLAATSGEAEIAIDGEPTRYVVRRWVRVARATPLRSASDDTWTCASFGEAIDLAVEKTR